jgi:hypothetical protein
MWRGRLGLAYLFPALSSAGASLSKLHSVSTSRSSNRTSAFRASGSRRNEAQIRSGPAVALMRRAPSTISGQRVLKGLH